MPLHKRRSVHQHLRGCAKSSRNWLKRSMLRTPPACTTDWFLTGRILHRSLLAEADDLTRTTNRSGWLNNVGIENHMMIVDLMSYLPDDILVKVDRAAMRVALESRVPFLDHRVIEFAWSLPMKMKIRDGKGKWLLRQLLENYVPRDLFERPKTGFGIPIDYWLRGPLREWASDLLNPSRIAADGYFNAAPISTRSGPSIYPEKKAGATTSGMC